MNIYHVLSVPHTATNKLYCGCAFTQKVLNLCKMLKMSGHYVIHYGNEGSEVDCDENITILKEDEILKPEDALRYALFEHKDKWYTEVCKEIQEKKKQSNINLLLCPWSEHRRVAEQHTDMIDIESGIGYPYEHFARHKVFESYAILHAYYGLDAIAFSGKFEWYNRIIPNYFDPNDFEFSRKKQDYLLFLGSRHGGLSKGFSIAANAARDAGVELIAAGPDEPTDIDKYDNVTYVGLLDIETRKEYLSKARALIAPSLFLEPFCGAQVEAYLSGTPVISTDWGAFAEYNINGLTGYRCRTHRDFVDAIDKVKHLNLECIYNYSEKFTLERVRHLYDAFYTDIIKCFDGSLGWYS